MPESIPALPTLPPARIVRRGGCDIAYFVVGPDEGRPLVLCHGLAASGLQFVADAEFFAGQGFRVLVPDLRGHGRSQFDKNLTGADFSIAVLAADLRAMLDAENIAKTDWVGNSLGGIVALSLMGTDRGRLRRFVSFGTAYALDISPMIVGALQLGYAMVPRWLLAQLGAITTCKNPAARAVIFAMLNAMNLQAVRHVTQHVRRYDLTANAVAFDGPVLMIRGDQDRAVNLALSGTLSMMQQKPNFELLRLRHAGHCANLDQPEQVRQAILTFFD